MAKYRIKQRVFYNTTNFEVQKKVWFWPFWYNFNNISPYCTGIYDTYEVAIEAIKIDKFGLKTSIIDVD